MDRLNTWRTALTDVTNQSGYLVPKNMSQTYIISKVINEVSLSIDLTYWDGLSARDVKLPPPKWDVFVSCGDTRCAFPGHLFDALNGTGIRIFQDDPELHSMEGVSGTLSKVIKESKIYVVVFSDTYASSRRCLNKLVEICKYCNSTGKLILPVFYNIEPATVRYPIGSFKKAFQEHEICYGKDRVDKWRVTLTNVGNLSGYQVHKNMSQIDIINKVVDRVLFETNSTTLNVANDPDDPFSKVKGIAKFLSNVTEHVIRFGIHGKGHGEKVLALVLFQQLWRGSFKRCCFLEDVKVSRTANGLVSLQQQLLNDILPDYRRIKIDDVDQGIEVIRARICSMIVLIVLDDVHDPRTLDSLVGTYAPGSIIIITTENESLLDSIKVEAKYKVDVGGDAKLRQLCWNF